MVENQVHQRQTWYRLLMLIRLATAVANKPWQRTYATRTGKRDAHCEYTVYTPCVAKETRQRNFIGLMQNSIATAIRSLPVVLVWFLATFVLCMSRNYLWPKDLLSKSYDTVATGRARASDSNPVTTILESFKCCCNTGITKSKNYAHPMFFCNLQIWKSSCFFTYSTERTPLWVTQKKNLRMREFPGNFHTETYFRRICERVIRYLWWTSLLLCCFTYI